MPDGGRIVIATSNVTFDAPAVANLHPDARPGDYIRLAVADDGVGMPPEVLARAMEPFFTTKGPCAGTGLGLASVASFAKQTGGFVALASTPGRGCVVSLYLPRSAENTPAPDIRADDLLFGDGELVLVVEDDDQVREVTLKRVESLGYAVDEAKIRGAGANRAERHRHAWRDDGLRCGGLGQAGMSYCAPATTRRIKEAMLKVPSAKLPFSANPIAAMNSHALCAMPSHSPMRFRRLA